MPQTKTETTTWWRVTELLGYSPKVSAVPVVKETDKTVTTQRLHWQTGQPVTDGRGRLILDVNQKTSQLARYFPEEYQAYLFALEHAAVAELSDHVLRIGGAR